MWFWIFSAMLIWSSASLQISFELAWRICSMSVFLWLHNISWMMVPHEHLVRAQQSSPPSVCIIIKFKVGQGFMPVTVSSPVGLKKVWETYLAFCNWQELGPLFSNKWLRSVDVGCDLIFSVEMSIFVHFYYHVSIAVIDNMNSPCSWVLYYFK